MKHVKKNVSVCSERIDDQEGKRGCTGIGEFRIIIANQNAETALLKRMRQEVENSGRE